MRQMKSALAFGAAIVLATLPAAPAMATPAAQKLSIRSAPMFRASAVQKDANKIGGGSTIYAILLVIAVAVGVAVAVKPKSP